jgi:hypothetical protein
MDPSFDFVSPGSESGLRVRSVHSSLQKLSFFSLNGAVRSFTFGRVSESIERFLEGQTSSRSYNLALRPATHRKTKKERQLMTFFRRDTVN